ncbi:tetraketide alpha-pyrone reductase, partial [Acrasis kona]
VCVTGASGYIAQHLVHQLVQRGYNVKATVRNKNDSAKLVYLNQLKSENENSLEIVEGDLLQPGSFDKAVEGCETVFHTASPFFFIPPDKKEEGEQKLIKVAVDGTKNVLESVGKTDSVKRVVLTSSVAAVINPLNPHTKEATGEDWNTNSKLEDVMGAYRISKTKAEQEAWAWTKDHPNVDLVAINPAFVVGPVLPPVATKDFKFPNKPQSLGTSCDTLRKFLVGENKTAATMHLGWVDVRDIALMHILSAERPHAKGNRYIGSAKQCTQYDVIQGIMKELYPKYNIDVSKGPGGPEYSVIAEKSEKDLGFKFRDLKETIKDMCDSLIELGYVEKKE